MSEPKCPVRVVTEATNINRGLRSGMVVLEAEKMDDLCTLEASQLAIETASQEGLLSAAIRDRGTIYTVTADGKPITDVTAGFPPGGKFRIDIKVGSTH